MAAEIFTDHTSIQALRKRRIGQSELHWAARELLQMIEHLLLSDVVWINNLVPAHQFDIANEIVEMCRKHKLADARGTGCVRMAQFSQEQHSCAIRSAAPEILETVECMSAGDLRDFAQNVPSGLQPAAAPVPLSFHKLRSVPFGSKAADRVVSKGLADCGSEENLSPFLINPVLYEWLRELLRQTTDPNDMAFQHLHTIVRWKINTQLARQLDTHEDNVVVHAPAFGRALCIARQCKHIWQSDQRAALEQWLYDVLRHERGRADVQNLVTYLAPFNRREVPLFGVWLLLQLPEQCTIELLLDTVSEARNSDLVRRGRDWLQSVEPSELEEVCQEVEREILLSDAAGRKKQRITTPRLRTFVQILLQFPLKAIGVELSQKVLDSLADLPFQLRRIFERRRPATVVTGIVDGILQEHEVYDRTMDRVASLIRR